MLRRSQMILGIPCYVPPMLFSSVKYENANLMICGDDGAVKFTQKNVRK